MWEDRNKEDSKFFNEVIPLIGITIKVLSQKLA